jgi:hypothetical protein
MNNSSDATSTRKKHLYQLRHTFRALRVPASYVPASYVPNSKKKILQSFTCALYRIVACRCNKVNTFWRRQTVFAVVDLLGCAVQHLDKTWPPHLHGSNMRQIAYTYKPEACTLFKHAHYIAHLTCGPSDPIFGFRVVIIIIFKQ